VRIRKAMMVAWRFNTNTFDIVFGYPKGVEGPQTILVPAVL
jgi:hypothetical protein